MKAHELIKLLNDGALSKYSELYSDVERAKKRFITAINEFTKTYGTEKDIALFSVPGRSEIIGNHTDHNRGKVMAGAIDRDIIAVAAKNDGTIIRTTADANVGDEVNLRLADGSVKCAVTEIERN